MVRMACVVTANDSFSTTTDGWCVFFHEALRWHFLLYFLESKNSMPLFCMFIFSLCSKHQSKHCKAFCYKRLVATLIISAHNTVSKLID